MKKKIFLVGFMGSGKTFWANKIARKTGLRMADLDDYIVQKTNKTITQIFDNEGEVAFRLLERTYLEKVTKNSAIPLIALGGGTPCFRDNIDWILKHGVVIYLEMPVSILLQNLQSATTQRPLLKGKSLLELEQYIRHKMEERKPYYQQANYTVSYQEDTAVMLKQLLAIISNHLRD